MESNVKSHRDLIVWQKAMDLTVDMYRITRTFPREELYGLTSQIRRSCSSVAANVAEGQGRRTSKEFLHFLANARGSLLELDTHLELALRIDYLSSENYKKLKKKLDEVGKILNGLMRSIKSRG